jgi:hypothetical protein
MLLDFCQVIFYPSLSLAVIIKPQAAIFLTEI